MRSRLRRSLLVLSIGCLLLGCGVILAGVIAWMGEKSMAGVTPVEQQLVYQSDHHAILNACNAILIDPESNGFPGGKKFVAGPSAGGKLPEQLPAALRQLNFEDLSLYDNHVRITFGGGFYHWGFEASQGARDIGKCELIPGLWYWNELGKLPPAPNAGWHFQWSAALFSTGIILVTLSIVAARRADRVETAGPMNAHT